MSTVSGPRNIDYLLEEIVTLPSMPATLARIVKLVGDPDCALSDVGKAISADPAIALKTLRLVNSAYYGLRQKVSSVENAVTLLGLKVIKNLVFTATVFDSLSAGAESLLRHSVSCGLAMRVLAESGGKRLAIDPEEAFVHGLLHDVGKLILAEFLPEDCARVREVCVARGAPSYAVEREIIGATHAEVGARLAQKWRLPDDLVQAIEGHHEPLPFKDPMTQRLAACLGVADYVCTAAGMGSSPGAVAAVHPEAWSSAGVSTDDVPGILDAFFARVPEIDELIELVS